MKTILLYVTLGLLAHAFVLVPLLMGLALNKKKHRDEAGKLNFRKSSSILKFAYLGTEMDAYILGKNIQMPKNICQLYWGIFWGILFKIPCNLFFWPIYFTSFILWHIGAIFFGFWPKGNWKFHPYKKCGWHSEQKILLLPWEAVLLMLGILFVLCPSDFLSTSLSIAGWARNNIVIQVMAGVVFCAVVLAIIMLVIAECNWIIDKAIDKAESIWAMPFKEFIKAKKQKWCPQINVE